MVKDEFQDNRNIETPRRIVKRNLDTILTLCDTESMTSFHLSMSNHYCQFLKLWTLFPDKCEDLNAFPEHRKLENYITYRLADAQNGLSLLVSDKGL
jgi:hypothetical protein